MNGARGMSCRFGDRQINSHFTTSWQLTVLEVTVSACFTKPIWTFSASSYETTPESELSRFWWERNVIALPLYLVTDIGQTRSYLGLRESTKNLCELCGRWGPFSERRGEGGQEISAKIAAFFNFSSKIIGSAHRMQTDGLTDCMTGKDEEHAIRLGPKES